MSYYSYYNHWRPMDIYNVDGYVLPFGKKQCGKTRAYIFTGASYIMGSRDKNRIHWGLVVNNGKEHTCFEIFYKFPYGNDDSSWHTVPYEVFSGLFNVKKGKGIFGDKVDNKWQEACEVVKVSDRAILTFPTSFIRSALWGVNKDTVRDTLAAKLVEGFDDVLAIAIVHSYSIKNMTDAKTVIGALKELGNVGWKIWDNKFDAEKDEYFVKIQNEEKHLDGFNTEFQTCCDAAADAMNRLSSNFGIEVQL